MAAFAVLQRRGKAGDQYFLSVYFFSAVGPQLHIDIADDDSENRMVYWQPFDRVQFFDGFEAQGASDGFAGK